MTVTDAARSTRRAGGVTIDQIISSCSNLLVLIWSAHLLQPVDFGRFSLLMMVYTVALGVVHALVSVPAIAHPEEVDAHPWRVLSSAFLVAVLVALPCALIAGIITLTGDQLGKPALVMAVFLPFVLLQDVGRYVAFARATPGKAVVLDTVWLVLLIAALGVCRALDAGGLFRVTLAWAGTGAAAALLLVLQYGVPRERASLTWLQSHWSFSWRSLAGNMTATGGALVGSAAVALVSNPLSVAAIRASMLLRRPGQVVQSSISTAVANDVARERPDRRGLKRHQRRAMLLAVGAAVANLALLVYLPDPVGHAILGGVWDLVAPLRWPVGLMLVVLATQAGMRAVLLGERQIATIMRTEIIGTVISMSVMVVGAAWAGAEGALWGVAAGSLVASLIWRWVFVRYLRSDRPADAPDDAPADAPADERADVSPVESPQP